MTGMHCTCRSLLAGAFDGAWQRSTSTTVPSFLLPTISINQAASFSSSASLQKRRRKQLVVDNNPWRHVSALRHSGINPKQIKLSVRAENLPKPVLDPKQRSKVEVDEDHGLWGFFNEKRTALWTPEELNAHGRSWTKAELRRKNWDDLHALWWVCVKELNQVETHVKERERLGNMYGEREEDERRTEIQNTMKAIRHVLIERQYSWEDARELAQNQKDIDLNKDALLGESALIPIDQFGENERSEWQTTDGGMEQLHDEASQKSALNTDQPSPDAPRPSYVRG